MHFYAFAYLRIILALMFEISAARRMLIYFLFRMMVRFSANVAHGALKRYLVQIAFRLFHRGEVNTVDTAAVHYIVDLDFTGHFFT
jgi:hypothetical protein